MKDNITIYSPGNIVSITISSNMEIVDIEIKDDIFTIEQKPLLEEMISSTINQAYQQMSSKHKDVSDRFEESGDHNSNEENDSGKYNNPYSIENINSKMKDILGSDEGIKDAIGNIMGNFKIEYKDGKPYCSMPMDMIDNEALANIMDMLNSKK